MDTAADIIVDHVSRSPHNGSPGLKLRYNIGNNGPSHTVPCGKHIVPVTPWLLTGPQINGLCLLHLIHISHFRKVPIAFAASVKVKFHTCDAIDSALSGKQFMKTHLANPIHAKAMIKTNHREGTRSLGKPYVSPQKFMIYFQFNINKHSLSSHQPVNVYPSSFGRNIVISGNIISNASSI